jgi:hypothetical protein
MMVNKLQLPLFDDMPQVDFEALRRRAADDLASLRRHQKALLDLHEALERARALQNDDRVTELLLLERRQANLTSAAAVAVADWKRQGLL